MEKRMTGWFKGILQSEKSIRILVICGIAGMILIFLSGLGGNSRKSPAAEKVPEKVGVEYESELEQRLSVLIGNIEGCGRVEVLVTVQSGARSLYANQQKTETVTEEERGEDSTNHIKTSEIYENEYVLVKNADGSESALLTAQKQPDIQGVAVVCDGGEDTVVQQRIIDAVTTVLNISSNNVCVTKMAE